MARPPGQRYGSRSRPAASASAPAPATAPHPPPPSQQDVPMSPVENTYWENTTADFRELVLASHEAKRSGRNSEAVLLACLLLERYPSSPLAGHIFGSAAASALVEVPCLECYCIQRVRRAFWYLYHANEKTPEPAQIDCATKIWNGMTEEQRAGFLSVNVEEVKAFLYRNSQHMFEPWPERVLSDAVSFGKYTGSWVYWCCPTCEQTFVTEESFAAHVESEHLLHIPTELKPLIYGRVPCEDAELLKSSYNVVYLNPDASCLLLDAKKFVKTHADGSFVAEELFNWLFGMHVSGRRLEPWIQVMEGNRHERTHVLEELNLLIKLLGICRLKHEISECDLAQYGKNLLDEDGPLDSERLILKIQCLKKKLADASTMDFRVAILPIIKSYLWAKLMGEDTEMVSQAMLKRNAEKLSELKMKIECLNRALPDRSKVPEDNQRVFWRVIVRSLWYLRRFREKILVTIPGFRHFRDIEGPCILCVLYKIFDAWDKKEDDEVALLLPKIETALKNTLRSSSIFQKFDGNSAYEVIARIFEILHMSQTLSFDCTAATLEIQATQPSRCMGNTCIVHNLFGICNDHWIRSGSLNEMTCQYSSVFHFLQGKSFIDLSKVMDQPLISDVGSGGILKSSHVDRLLSHPSHFFTAVVIWPDVIIDSYGAICKILVSMASTFDISLMFESNQCSDNKYALVSMICQCNQSHLMFARCGDDSKKWLVYNGDTCEEPSELEKLLARHAARNLQPEVLFLERIKQCDEVTNDEQQTESPCFHNDSVPVA